MYLRGEISGYDMELEIYELVFKDGPYLGDDVADGQQNFQVPLGGKVLVKGVSSAFLIVDLYNNYGSHTPIFLVCICLVQIFCFVHFVHIAHPDVTVTSSSPNAGVRSLVNIGVKATQ